MEFKIVLNAKNGKSYAKTVDGSRLIGMKIGDTVKGELIGMAGYECKITGGSDFAGFPMRSDVPAVRKRVLAIKGIGLRNKEKGRRIRFTVAGNTVHEKTAQLNLQILKEGKEPLEKPAEAAAAPAAE